MDDVHPLDSDALQSSVALRQWSASLRLWSRSTRRTACAERERSHTLRAGVVTAVPPVMTGGPTIGELEANAFLPGLGEVPVCELLQIVLDRHDFGFVHASRALRMGMLVAGYPGESQAVSAADAFEILDWVRYHVV